MRTDLLRTGPCQDVDWVSEASPQCQQSGPYRVDVPGASLWIQPSSRDQETAECFRQPLDTKDIFALPSELYCAILEGAAVNGENLALNRMALVGCSWHNLLAPPAGACIPALTRQVTLGEPDLL